MAEVHLGTMVSPAGNRHVAIKRLLSSQEASPQAAKRLVDEARLVFQLTHANICQMLDLGLRADGAFIVMEYVDGCDLHHLLSRLRAHGRHLELPSAIHI